MLSKAIDTIYAFPQGKGPNIICHSIVLHYSRAEVEILRKYAALEDSIVGMGLDGVWLVKPLLNVTSVPQPGLRLCLYRCALYLCVSTCREGT